MGNDLQSPFQGILVGLALVAVGVVLYRYRNEIGSFTGYYTGRGGYVDKPTPGCMLIPFALALVAGGLFLAIRILFFQG